MRLSWRALIGTIERIATDPRTSWNERTVVGQTAEVRFPSPDDLAQAPLWENYVVAQTSAASLGLIPLTALAVGVEIDGVRILLRFRLAQLVAGDREDMTDIADELSDLLGPAIEVNHAYQVVSEPGLKPDDGVCWIFRSRTDLSLEHELPTR